MTRSARDLWRSSRLRIGFLVVGRSAARSVHKSQVTQAQSKGSDHFLATVTSASRGGGTVPIVCLTARVSLRVVPRGSCRETTGNKPKGKSHDRKQLDGSSAAQEA